MGILDNVERGLERAVNGAFARTFRSGVQPVEIASALKRELDISSVIVDRDRVLAPNRFVVRVSQKDADRLLALGDTLEQELRGVVAKHANQQNYQLLGEADVEIVADDSLTAGVLQIDASRVEGAVDWVAIVEVDGARHDLRTGTTTVGRGSDCDIRITDNGASRKHLQFIWDGAQGIARDLGSTNGSKINGQRFREAQLVSGSVITIGQTSLRFALAPGRKAPTRAQSPSRAQQTTPMQQAPAPAPPRRTAPPAAPQSDKLPPISEMPSASGTAGASRGASDAGAPGIDQDFWRGL